MRKLRTRGLCAAAVAVAAMAALPVTASAVDRYASPTGVGSTPCASGDPCPLDFAVEGASASDQVILVGGVPPAAPFTPPPNVNVPNDVVVRGATGARPVVNFASDTGFFLGSASVLRDLDIEYTGTTGVAIQFTDGAAPGVIERVFAHADGGAMARAPCFVTGDAVIRDSVCWYDTDSIQSAAIEVRALFAPEDHTLTVRNSTAISSPATPGGQDEPAIMGRASDSGAQATINVTNTIAWSESGPDVQGLANAGGAVTIALDHSNYATESAPFDPASITDPGTATNQTPAPVFVDAAAGDFRQTATSNGTLELGTATGLLPGELDLDGNARSQGTTPDIGAYEFPTVITPPPGGGDPPATTPKKKCKKKKAKKRGAAAAKKKCKKKKRK